MTSIWTRDEVLSLLADWKAAYKAASTGKSYSIGGRTLTRYDLADIRAQISYLENERTALSGTRGSKRIIEGAAMNMFSALKQLFFGRRPMVVSRDAGSVRGTIATWRVSHVYSQSGETAERRLTQGRTADLYVNDWAARSVVNTISTNAVGTGLMPQSQLPWRRLGITKKQACELESNMEWLWAEWCLHCHAKGTMQFGDLQLSGFRSVLRAGEMVMKEACLRGYLPLPAGAPDWYDALTQSKRGHHG